MSNQTHRVLELIRRFNRNQKVCIEQLQNEYMWEGKSDKTIRRDLDIIKEMFSDTFHRIGGEKGCYKAITSELFSNITSAENMSLLIQTFNIAQRSNLFDTLNIDKADKSIIERKIKESKNIYLFKTKPFENRSGDFGLFRILESAIYHRKKLNISYQVHKGMIKVDVKPYNIVFVNENFYLACEVEHPKYQFSLYRISKITQATPTGEHFHQNLDIARFIKDIQTPFARYTPDYRSNLIEIIVEVDATKAQYFRDKKHLLSQKIIEEKTNGNLLLSYTVTQEMELEELVKRWLPHMRVVSPKSLDTHIRQELSKYLDNIR